METYPDMRLHQGEEEIYCWFKSQDYKKISDPLFLFSSFNNYLKALKDTGNYFHKEALQIRENRMITRLSQDFSERDDRILEEYEQSREIQANPLK